MRVITRFELDGFQNSITKLQLSIDAKILSVDNDEIVLNVLENPEQKSKAIYNIAVYSDRCDIDFNIESYTFLGVSNVVTESFTDTWYVFYQIDEYC